MTTKSSAYNDARKFMTELGSGPYMGMQMKKEVADANEIIERTIPLPKPKEEITTAATVSGGGQGVASTTGVVEVPQKKKRRKKNLKEDKNFLSFLAARKEAAKGIATEADKAGDSLNAKHFNARVKAYDYAIAASEEGEEEEYFSQGYANALNRLGGGGLNQDKFQEVTGNLVALGEIAMELAGSEPAEEPKAEPADEPEAE